MKSVRFSLLLATLAWAAQAHAQALSTATVHVHDVDTTYPAEAVIEAVKQATVAAQVQGRVVAVRVDAGQRVRAGEVVMRIDAREASHNLAGAQANLINAKASYERTQDLFARKFVSKAALDKAEADYKAASASAGQAGTVVDLSTITAPISGVVAERQTELGEMAAPGKPLLTVFDPSGLRALADIPQYKLAAIRGTPKAKVEFPETGKWIDAARVEVLPTADARTHSVQARVYLPADVAGVIPGMFARVHFILGTSRKLTVPAAAVLRRGEVTAVYVIDTANQPHLRQVRLGEAVPGGDFEALAGISPGEKVALDPVKAGIAVKQTVAAEKR